MEQKNRILIVDDAEINRSLLADILSPVYETLEAANGLEAISILSRQSGEISLVLLDVVMPEMDGFEVLETMRRSGWLSNIPVIMISAESAVSYVDRAYDLGATDYITRPFDERTVQHRVRNILALYARVQSVQCVDLEPVSREERKASGRTLALLEQERIKYQFYASMTKEILFEYDCGADLLEFSEWGAKYLGVPELISRPAGNQVLAAWGDGYYQDMKRLLLQTSPENPIASGTYCLRLHGERHWFKVVARTLGGSEENASFTRVIGKLVDIHDDHVRIKKLQDLAMRDSLTVLYNNKATRDAVTRDLAQRRSHAGMLIIFDLDSFKSVNDQYGHGFGDCVLKHVAKNIQACIRKGDIAGRIGGDEFLVYMSYDRPEDPDRLASRVFDAATGQYENYAVTISMGVAVCPKDGVEYDVLFHCADMALYDAKRKGKNQLCFYDPNIQDFSSARTPIDIVEHSLPPQTDKDP